MNYVHLPCQHISVRLVGSIQQVIHCLVHTSNINLLAAPIGVILHKLEVIRHQLKHFSQSPRAGHHTTRIRLRSKHHWNQRALKSLIHLLWNTDLTHHASKLDKRKQLLHTANNRPGINEHIQGRRVLSHFIGIIQIDKGIRTRLQNALSLTRGRTNRGDMTAHNLCQFNRDGTQTAESDDANLPAWIRMVAQGLEHGSAGAHERTCHLNGHIVGDLDGETLLDSLDAREATAPLIGALLSPAACGGAEKGALVALFAEVFAADLARRTEATRVANPGDADHVADGELATIGAQFGHVADRLVAGQNGVVGYAPVVVLHVQVGVAETDHFDFDLNHRRFERGQRHGREREWRAALQADVALGLEGVGLHIVGMVEGHCDRLWDGKTGRVGFGCCGGRNL